MQLVHEQMNGIPGVSGASTITITIMSTIANSNRINIITNAIHFLFISLNHNERMSTFYCEPIVRMIGPLFLQFVSFSKVCLISSFVLVQMMTLDINCTVSDVCMNM